MYNTSFTKNKFLQYCMYRYMIKCNLQILQYRYLHNKTSFLQYQYYVYPRIFLSYTICKNVIPYANTLNTSNNPSSMLSTSTFIWDDIVINTLKYKYRFMYGSLYYTNSATNIMQELQ